MSPSDEIDNLIHTHPDWRGAALARLRQSILAVDPGITEEWKWMGAPVWELGGILVVGNIFKTKVKLGFMYGALQELIRAAIGHNLARATQPTKTPASAVP